MKRRLFAILSAISLLLFVAAVVMWVRSYSYVLAVTRSSRPYDGSALHTHAVEAQKGRLIFRTQRWGRGGEKRTNYEASNYPLGFDGGLIDLNGFLGFGHEFALTPPDMVDSYYRVVTIPLWFVTALLAIPPLLRTTAWLRGRSLTCVGLCSSCGYDLRATPDRCPECGAAPTKAGT